MWCFSRLLVEDHSYIPLQFWRVGFYPIRLYYAYRSRHWKGQTLPYDEEYQYFHHLSSVLPHLDLHDELSSGLQIRCSYIRQATNELIHGGTSENHLEIARLFILYMMRNLFPTNASNMLPVGYVATVVELSFDSRITYDLGFPYQRICTALWIICVVRGRSSSITGFWELL